MKLSECEFTEEEIIKIRYLAKLFNCKRMFIDNIKLDIPVK